MTPAPGGGTAEDAATQARNVLNQLYSKPYPGSHAYTHAADAIAAALTGARAAGFAEAQAAAAKSDCQLCHDGVPVMHYRNQEVDEWFHMITSQNKPSLRAVCKAGHVWRLSPADDGQGGGE